MSTIKEGTPMDPARLQRRRLRLGALLFRLRYYMLAPEDVAANVYRHGPAVYVRVDGAFVTLVDARNSTVVTIDEAIEWCKAELEHASR